MVRQGLFISIGLIFLSQGIYSQEKELIGKDMSLYVYLARNDAKFEQDLQFISEDDEADFWKDQKNFENGLKQFNYTAYKVYLKTKKEVYAEHEALCKESCIHGIYYNAQASYYKMQDISSYAQNTSGIPANRSTTRLPRRKL